MQTWTTKNNHTVYRILGGRSNCYLVACNGKYLLIDTGPKFMRSFLHKRLQKLGVTASTLTGLILTHSHYDHAENAAWINKVYNTQVFIHSNEAEMLQQGKNPLVHGTNPGSYFLTDILRLNSVMLLTHYEPVTADVVVANSLDLSSLGFKGYIIHTPGHSPGSMSVIIDNEIAIVGDAMFGIFKKKIFPPFAWNARQMVSSWRNLLDTGCTVFLPAHGSTRSREVLYKEYDKYADKFNL